MEDLKPNQRLHLYPQERLQTVGAIAAMAGSAQGFFNGVKLSSLRYLTENAHRLPKTVGGWYFYHKKKNYIMLLAGFRQAATLAIKYSAGASAFLGLEAGLDYVRGTTDFLNTTAVGTVSSYIFGSANHMTRVQKWSFVKKGSLLALCYGMAQDALIYGRGGNVWYTKFGAGTSNIKI
ncbi:hypothetical protein METBIDRAFT_104071 [Metschnikowia bicuspidata var. bicuspidata NRRL YB-4993]|uniref:Uncharacterized protein n=1 Tax=Metschnikowia bicuspidata var. bicuspidata NRRL YB-4993 TaxID=869754 RepID=A0A1A0HH47_9ASCO|nr:hypothetical protein METBIDRAFT_104071 [Metschnikowia bicuspidata var. bicuspidata NRRL YB-4993]OBA23320.1 hypothetical protein METBIDRAFT_104071 [Metschnikowia bicuspidata var. bicuspidata NRRL YB-4993]